MRRAVPLLVPALLSGPAFASGYLDAPARDRVATGQNDWTGFYGGLQTGTLWGETGPFEFDSGGTWVFAGYRRDLGDFTVGGEIDYLRGTFDVGPIPVGLGVINLEYDFRLFRFGGEVGYDLGNALPYVTAGIAQMQLDLEVLLQSGTDYGLFYGIGFDYRVSDRIVLGVEALQHEFDDFPDGEDVSLTTFGVSVAFTF